MTVKKSSSQPYGLGWDYLFMESIDDILITIKDGTLLEMLKINQRLLKNDKFAEKEVSIDRFGCRILLFDPKKVILA